LKSCGRRISTNRFWGNATNVTSNTYGNGLLKSGTLLSDLRIFKHRERLCRVI
jgi:hypothetical protein